MSVELYGFLVRTLSSVYRYFLSRATAAGRLAEAQLVFERQMSPLGIVQRDYWVPPESTTVETWGLTGAERLLQDLNQIDELAFETNRRKHHVVKTFSLAKLLPHEFQQFRTTGVLPFATGMELFDSEFPGHYLRLIRRVRVSFVALIPAPHGLAAMLHCSGLSRAVVRDGGFQTIEIQRAPSSISISQPFTGARDDEREGGELLDAFEGLGVDTTWTLELAPASNPFDFDSLVDVTFTVEYTALFDRGYRTEVIARLPREIQAERVFSIKDAFPDVWYELANGTRTEVPLDLAFGARDLPPNHQRARIDAIGVYVVARDRTRVDLVFPSLEVRAPSGGAPLMLREARTYQGVLSTRLASGAAWSSLVGRPFEGRWKLAVAPGPTEPGDLQDIVIAIAYTASLPSWPVAWAG
jgi:hypothetical protein